MRQIGTGMFWTISTIAFKVVSIPVLLVVLFLAMAMGTRLLSALTGPVNIWNMPGDAPPASALAGTYRVDATDNDLHRLGTQISTSSGFQLGEDHALLVTDLPAFDMLGHPEPCRYNGTGTWNLDAGGSEVKLDLSITSNVDPLKGSPPSCPPEDFTLMEVLGHSAPYHVWYVVGDPDEDTGLRLVRR